MSELQSATSASLELYTRLLSREVTDCLTPVCENLQTTLKLVREPGNQRELFMMLKNGCPDLLTEDENNSDLKWCNYLLYEMDEADNTNDQKLEAANIFQEVNILRS